MATMVIVGNTLVDENEYLEKKQLGEIGKLNESLRSDSSQKVSFANGEVTTEEILENFDKINPGFEDAEKANPHTPIGLGLPLSVEILTIYTGDYPNGLFGGKKDLLLTSAIKSSVTFDAAARAINKIDKRPSENSYIEFVASEPGTRVVYYTPAVDSLNTLVSFELVADTFEQELFDQVSKLLSSAAGFPVFLPAANFLLGGAHLLKIAGSLGSTVLAKKAYLKNTYEVKFNNAGDFDAVARHLVLFNDQDVNAFREYESKLIDISGSTKFRLVHKQTQEVYNGDAPYLIINLDGKTRPDLEGFTPKLASTALLQKFYGEDDAAGKITSTIEEAMQLYNDMNYRTKAEKLQAMLSQLPADSEERTRNEALLEAYRKNIKNPAFQL